MENKLTIWQAFELGTKYYLILLGIIFLSIGVIFFVWGLLINDVGIWFQSMILFLFGIISITLAIISKVSNRK